MIYLFATMLQQGQTMLPYPPYSENLSIWRQMSEALHMSLYRVLSLLIAILPGILAFFFALGVFALMGQVVSSLLRWILTMAKFDARVARTGAGADWAPSTSPTALTARVTFWVFVLIGLVIGVSAFEASYAVGGVLPFSFLPYVTRLVGAAVLLILGTLIARFLSLRAHWRGECAVAVCAFSGTGRQMAGAGLDRGHGAGTSRHRQRYCRTGIQHSLRRHCAHARAGSGAGIARPGQPFAREPCGPHRTPARTVKSGASTTPRNHSSLLIGRQMQHGNALWR